jgi:sigma-B regulation protein RsbU (phosphoserine phosphatase)
MVRKSRLQFLFAAIVLCAAGSVAQTAPPVPDRNPRHFDARYVGTTAMLGPSWLFSPGDNSAFASLAYDDSNWQTVSIDDPLEKYGVRSARFVWYRIHVKVRTPSHFLVIETQYIKGACEIFVNGVQIGGVGDMASSDQATDQMVAFAIPDQMTAQSGDLVIALRVALNKTGQTGVGGISPLQSGSILLSTSFQTQFEASYAAAHQALIPFLLSGLGFVVGLVALALYLAMRSRTEYLAIAVSLLATALQLAEIALHRLHGLDTRATFWETLWLGVANVALIEFVRLILHLRSSRWLLALQIAIFLGYFGPNLARMGYLPPIPLLVAYFLPALVVQAALPILLVRGLLRGNRDARVVLPAIGVVSVANYWNFLATMAAVLNLPFQFPSLPNLPIGSYQADFWNVWNAIYFVTMLLFLVLRTIGIARQHARVAAELEAARIVQHVLIPDEIPSIPGFGLHSVYKPAGEVGGDFFQILPTTSGGVLVVVGDVSGKGMPAAMTVSLLVGTVRTLAHYTQSPGEILAAMNQRMLARSNGGFTTCIVVRVDADGKAFIANAGHLAPYINGQELVLENGLPLGLSGASSYRESEISLVPGLRMTLMTDGVVEAQDPGGELFGFDRTRQISTESAEDIAAAAQSHGQEDDITVLTLTFAPAAPVSA